MSFSKPPPSSSSHSFGQSGNTNAAASPEKLSFYNTEYSSQYQQHGSGNYGYSNEQSASYSSAQPQYQQQQLNSYYGGQQQQSGTSPYAGSSFHHGPSNSMDSGQIAQPISWMSAFGTAPIGDEPPLLEELGINVRHMWGKTVAVLNPLGRMDKALADDADCWGPILFILFFAASLLLSGKALFNFIYGVAVIGWIAIYGILNLMADAGIGGLQTASVLGYCLLPMAFFSWISVFVSLPSQIGLLLGTLIVIWCTVSSSNIFVLALSMKDQRLLVAYPVGLFYFCFALMTVF